MSMRQYGEHGYVVEALELAPLFTLDEEPEYRKYILEGDWEEAEKMIHGCLPNIPTARVFIFKEEDFSEVLEPGEMYVSFSESDLFEKTPTPQLKWLTNNKVTPKFNTWTVLA